MQNTVWTIVTVFVGVAFVALVGYAVSNLEPKIQPACQVNTNCT